MCRRNSRGLCCNDEYFICFLTNFPTIGYHNLLFLSGSSPFTKYLQKCRVTCKCLCRIVSVGSLFYFFHKLAPFCILSFVSHLFIHAHVELYFVTTSTIQSDSSLHPTRPPIFGRNLNAFMYCQQKN